MTKFTIIPEVIHHRPVYVTVQAIPKGAELDTENPKWPFDRDVKAGKALAVDCRELDKEMGR